MTILFDSARLNTPATFGAGLVDAPTPAKPRKLAGPSTADVLYWQAYQLGYEGEDPATPTGLSNAERKAWRDGLADGRTFAHVDLLLAAGKVEPTRNPGFPDGPYDAPRSLWGHPATEDF